MATLLRGVADLVFPPACQVCRTPGVFPLCGACRAGFRAIRPPICQKCGKPLRGSPDLVFTCIPCRHRRLRFTCARAAGVYEGALREAIHALKFGGRRALAEPLGTMMVEVAATDERLSSAELVVPVPLHASRLRERGFNQSEMLAVEIAQGLDRPLCTNLLERTRLTAPQSGLLLDDRRANVRGAFTRTALTWAGRILLVDDVISTGSTVSECARALRGCGASEVCVLTVAMAVLV